MKTANTSSAFMMKERRLTAFMINNCFRHLRVAGSQRWSPAICYARLPSLTDAECAPAADLLTNEYHHFSGVHLGANVSSRRCRVKIYFFVLWKGISIFKSRTRKGATEVFLLAQLECNFIASEKSTHDGDDNDDDDTWNSFDQNEETFNCAFVFKFNCTSWTLRLKSFKIANITSKKIEFFSEATKRNSEFPRLFDVKAKREHISFAVRVS